jgi:hypothetical protein
MPQLENLKRSGTLCVDLDLLVRAISYATPLKNKIHASQYVYRNAECSRAFPANIATLAGSIFLGQQGGPRRGGSSSESSDKTGHEVNRTTVLLGPTPLDTKSAQSQRDETVFGVRGVAGSVTHLDALLSQRLALLQTQISPVRLYLLELL